GLDALGVGSGTDADAMPRARDGVQRFADGLPRAAWELRFEGLARVVSGGGVYVEVGGGSDAGKRGKEEEAEQHEGATPWREYGSICSHEDLVRGCALPVRERLPAAVAPSPRLRIVRSAPVPTCEGRCPGAEKGFARSLRSRGLASRVADDVEPS